MPDADDPPPSPAPAPASGGPAETGGRIATLPPDRERDAGFRGDGYTKAAWALGGVFAAGLLLVLVVVLRARRAR